MALSFAADIRPLFRDEDVDCMKPMGIDLDDPAWMRVPANAQSVYSTVSAGSMPPDEPWDAERVSLFKRWMDAGLPHRQVWGSSILGPGWFGQIFSCDRAWAWNHPALYTGAKDHELNG